MSKIKVAINGFGRIGRITMRALLKKENIQVVAINDLTDTATLAHLFKYDSVHGKFDGNIEAGDKHLSINGNCIYIYSSKSPSDLPWKDLGIDVVIESTGLFRSMEDAGKHLESGAKKVIISAPPKGEVKTVVLGVNDNLLDGSETVLSNASCTTNCAAPMVKVLDELWGIESGFLSTIHAYTSDQRLHDAPHSDLRRARAAAANIIPTSTGAANAIVKIFPHLKGKLGGSALRVPVASGSITELTCVLKKEVSPEEINSAFKAIAQSELKGILEYSDEPLVSVDIISNPHSCIFDSGLTATIGKMVKVVGWYDNEAGYSNRLADLVEVIGT
ncbi:MAG: type I glyceraldehyde-3-phosphate dehydrogenase [Flavobacteriales bacterium]|nr:MAG: type I glyceraldehyde-3-phosphate dehydrogenase [Flavobacteriales bacterium]